jgi:hypothetical protein
MSGARFLLCRRCAVLHPLDAEGIDPSPEARESIALERRGFESDHAGHRLEEATRTSPSSSLDRPVWDPMATLWFFVRSGPEELLVRASRVSVEEPRAYRLDFEPPQSDALVEIDPPFVRRALDRHFYPQAVAARKLDHFIGVLSELVAGMEAAAVQTSFDDAEYADAGIAPLPDALCRSLIERCAGVFDPWELERLEEFVALHRDEAGALALRVHRSLAALSA